MRYNHIKRFLSAALLLAFTAPSGIAEYYNAMEPVSNSTVLSGDVKLTDKNERITLSLRDSDLKQVLRMFADKAGMNIVFHNSVKGKVTLDLVNMPINEAFDLVLQIGGLNYYTQNNTLVVIAKTSNDNAAFSKQEMMVFPVKYVSAAKIATFLNKNVFGMKKPGLSGVDAGPAQAHVVGVGLVAGGEAAACVSGEQDRADGKSGKEGRLGDFGVGFHDFFLLQMLSDGWQEKQKTFRRSCRLAEETKGRKPSAVPLFFVSCIGNTLNGIPSYPCYCNGSSRLHLLPIRRSRCTASSAA